MQQYGLLSRELKRNSNELLVNGDYPGLRRHKEHELIEPNFMDSRFKISLIARPPFSEGRGRSSGNGNGELGKTQVLLYTHGTFVDPADYRKGFIPQENYEFRVVVRNPISNTYPFHIPLIGELTNYIGPFREDLETGRYLDFTCNVLGIADETIGKYKIVAEQVLRVHKAVERRRGRC